MKNIFERFSSTETHRVIGLMSGTSVDGVDAALCEISGQGRGKLSVKILSEFSSPYPAPLRERILAACKPGGGSSAEICELNFVIGEEFAHAAKNAIYAAGLEAHDIDLIGSHGQTIWHSPTGRAYVPAGLAKGSTLQIGEAAVIAERTRVPVVSNFRARDMAAHGQGAPLVPYADWMLFSSKTVSRVALNIGGIANVTVMPAGCEADEVVAFDTGPGNMILDALAERFTGGKLLYDKDGKLAQAGKVDAVLLEELAQHKYFERQPPKSTGREEFGAEFARELYEKGIASGLSGNDILATATMLTARTIARILLMLHDLQLPELIVAGGGTRNPVLMKMLSAELSGWKVRSTDELGIPAHLRECVAFAILARETMLGRPSNLPSATGARAPRMLGDITP